MAATFTAHFDRIAPAANKYMVDIFNTTATRKVIIKRIWQYAANVTAVTGVLLEQEMRFITARTVGTSITPIAHDTNLTLTAGIAADSGSTSVTEATGNRALFKRWLTTAEEALLAELITSLEGAKMQLHDAQLIYWAKSDADGLVLRQNQGLVIKNITSSTVGTLSYLVEFTDEAA